MGAIVCRKGHEITRFPQHFEGPTKFCPNCGSPAVTACETCGAAIPPGDLIYDWTPPTYCGQCGSPWPWTAASLASASELIDMLDGLTDEERQALKGTLGDLVVDTPGTEVAAMKFSLLARKASQEGGRALRTIVTSVATEAAKRLILGP